MSVYKAINAVQKALSETGISKGRKNTQQGYSFRGIDDVYNTLSPMLAEHGLCILPRMLSRTCDERQTKNGGVLFYVTVEAEFDFVSAIDGTKHTVKTFGEAMDSGDKATNKAMSAAYKYAALQAFAIPTEGDNDADSQAHEPMARGSNKPQQQKQDNSPKARAARLTEGVKNGDAVNAAAAAAYWPEAELNAVWALLDPEIIDQLTANWPGA